MSCRLTPARFRWAAPAAITTLIVLSGCTLTAGTVDAEAGATAEAFGHIHGLGADPLTGNTYAATHHGVWLISTADLPDSYLGGAEPGPPAAPLQLAGGSQDMMGFTVAVPGTLLASGHPDAHEASDLATPNLGLISSTDAAASWTNLSLAGRTDFHDLDAVPLPSGTLRVYGYDAGAGALAISDDSGQTWTAGASLAMRDLTADRADSDRVLATTADGLAESRDAGHSFQLIADAPALLLVEAVDQSAGGGFVGIDAGGAVWRQDPATQAWSETGSTGRAPDALTFAGGNAPWMLVADAAGIAGSDDYGATWTDLLSLGGE
ncbi:hypothetical protein E3T55_03060 [Cryobacterium frigoriphilum]|uniref:Exo-alpha-sialidase n=1 Tax=Cryobacterium frigoriphilum TaxID=1259150 RepID=A0A4R9A9L5_9MICO|nr:hypothetical protein [Cryobacterium frigoriphilum]TFD54432.1 hypothetical protein E3T55_03060 [Cryobacterium frigoriphilum]